MLRINISILLLAGALFLCGCGKIQGPNFPVIPSPRVTVATPTGPASGNIAISFALIDRELESADILVQYSTDGGQNFATATLTNPADAANLGSGWYPGATHTLQWDSVTDMVGRSGEVQVCIKLTPSDATNPSGTADITGTFTVNNIAYNEAPSVTASTPAGVQSGNIQINYFLADVESDTCSIVVDFSTNGGGTWQTATMGPAGDGLSGLSSSPSGDAHTFLWDSRTDNVGLTSQQDNVKIRITPTDFNEGTVDETNAFSVDNTTPNIPPTVNITSGPSQGSTVYTPQVTFGWSGSDTDGTVTGYYYSFDRDPPDVWTTNTSVTSGVLSEASHTFRVAAMDDEGALSTVASRTFTVSAGIIQANFTGSPVSGSAPLAVSFTDTSTSTSGITSWSWSFGDGGSSTSQNPSHTYNNAGSYTVTLTVSGPDGSDAQTRTSYISVTLPGSITANFTADTTAGQAPLAVSFTDTSTSTSGITSWSWSFGDGGSSTSQNPSHTYSSAGNYTVTLTVGGPDGTDTDTKTNYITVSSISSGPAYGWTRAMGSMSYDEGRAIATDPSGNVYVTGYFRATVDFGADFGTSDSKTPQGLELFVTKINSNGTYGWTKAMGGGADDCGEGIATDTSGNVYVTGYFEGTVNFGSDFGTSDSKASQGYRDIFVTKINSDGTYGWTKAMGGTSSDWGLAIATDSSGNIYVTGRFEDTVDFGANFGTSQIKTSHGYEDISITKINSDGTYGWTRAMGSVGNDYGYAIATDPSDNVYVTGSFRGTADFGADFGTSDIRTPWGLSDIFVMKINSNGTYGWTKIMGGTSNNCGYGIATDPSGNVYVTGSFEGTADFGADFGTSDSKTALNFRSDIFVTKINSGGSYGWTKAIGVGSVDIGYAIAADASGSVYVTGHFMATVDFGADFGTSESKTSQGAEDIFVTRINSNGTYGWTRVMGGGSEDYGRGIATDSSGNVYVAGYFNGTVDFGADFGISDSKVSQGGADIFVTKIGQPNPPRAGFTSDSTDGEAPLDMQFTDTSTGEITSWAWDFGDSGSSNVQNPQHTYSSAGTYTVTLAVTGPGGSDTETKTNLITVTAPVVPTLAGAYDTPSYALGVYVSGSYAYVADALSGLQIIDISNPASPTLAGAYDTPGSALGVYVSGSYAYVADWESGLQIIDISNPASPTLAGAYDTPDEANGVYVSGSYAYVAEDDAGGLQIINISNPASPSLAGSYDTPGYAMDVYVSGSYAYVADGSSGLQIIDISNPASPTLAGSYDTPGPALGVYVSGSYAYVADHDSGLQIIAISNPASPTLAGSYDTPGSASGVYVSGSYAYVADRDSGLQIIDISNPASPTLAGSYDTPGSALGVYVSGSYAYVAYWEIGLQIIRIFQ